MGHNIGKYFSPGISATASMVHDDLDMLFFSMKKSFW